MSDHVDLIVTNARILTMDEGNPRAEAIAIHDGTIVAVGDEKPIEELKGPATKTIDAGGNSVVPGFIEAHMHLFAGAAELEHLQLFGVSGFDALSRAVRSYAAKRPDARLLQGQGADYTILSADQRVTRHHLDRIIADRPFAMSAPDHHTMWANTRALELAGRSVRATRSSWAPTGWRKASCARARRSGRCWRWPDRIRLRLAGLAD